MSKKIILGVVSILLITSIIVLFVTSLSGYAKRQKEYRTPMGWALEEAKDFFSVREEEDFHMYEISEMTLINYKAEPGDGEYFKVFYVKIIDDNYNFKEYYVAISYNLDNSFWAKFFRGTGSNELIGLEHIVWLDADDLIMLNINKTKPRK